MFRFYVQAEVKVTKASHMDELVNSDTRIILLYSTKVVIMMIIMIMIIIMIIIMMTMATMIMMSKSTVTPVSFCCTILRITNY